MSRSVKWLVGILIVVTAISIAAAVFMAAERGDTSRLDAALAYFEEQQATPYVERCRALMQASA